MFKAQLYCAIWFGVALAGGQAFAQDGDGSSGARPVEQDPGESASQATGAELTERAEAHFSAGEYDEAVALLERAYELDGDSITLFNLAHVLEQKGDLERARDYYDQFAMISDVDLEYREEAAKRAKVLRNVIDSRVEDDDTRPEPTSTVEVELTPEQPEAVSPWRPVGIGMAGVGVGALGVGLVAGLLALNAESDFEASTTLAEGRASADKARTLAAVADTLFVAGGVLTVTGAVIAATTLGSKSKSRVGVNIGHGSMGATWGFAF